MGNICPCWEPKDPKGNDQRKPPGNSIAPEPSYDFIVRGNFIPQQNGDLKVREEQGSPDFTSRNYHA